MKKHLTKFLIFLFFSCNLGLLGQGTQYFFRLRLDKKNKDLFSLFEPQKYLSNRAINRRSKQGVAIDENDFPVNPYYLDTLQSLGFDIEAKTKWLNEVVIGTKDSISIDKVKAYPWINSFLFIGKKTAQKSSYNKFESPNVSYAQGKSRNQLEIHGYSSLQKQGYLGQGILIAVTDAGFSQAKDFNGLKHLWRNNQVIGTYDFVNNQEDVFHSSSHGTSVLSVMGAYDINEFQGSAISSDYLLLITEDVAIEQFIEEYHWLEAAEYADSVGADVINVSLGYKKFDDDLFSLNNGLLKGNQAEITRGVNIAFTKGILVVTSAGNSGGTDDPFISAPADANFGLSVGGITQDKKTASFSSRGLPNLINVKPELVAVAQGTYLADSWNGSGYLQSNGTSFSSPLVAGLAASLWSKYTSWDVAKIRTKLIESGSQYNNPDSIMGNGWPHLDKIEDKYGNVDTANFDFNIYPNPTKSGFSFSTINIQKVEQLMVFDINGKKVFSTENPLNFQYFNLNLSTGVYSVQVQYKDIIKSKKLIISKI